MKSIEQAGPAGAGTVTAACVFVGGEPHFELVVYPAVLRLVPWFRGGQTVAAVLAGSTLRLLSSGPHRLLARATNRLEKLPPVQLRMRQMEHLRPVPQAAEPVPFDVGGMGLAITLPAWARPPSASAPIVFGRALAGGVA